MGIEVDDPCILSGQSLRFYRCRSRRKMSELDDKTNHYITADVCVTENALRK